MSNRSLQKIQFDLNSFVPMLFPLATFQHLFLKQFPWKKNMLIKKRIDRYVSQCCKLFSFDKADWADVHTSRQGEIKAAPNHLHTIVCAVHRDRDYSDWMNDCAMALTASVAWVYQFTSTLSIWFNQHVIIYLITLCKIRKFRQNNNDLSMRQFAMNREQHNNRLFFCCHIFKYQ